MFQTPNIFPLTEYFVIMLANDKRYKDVYSKGQRLLKGENIPLGARIIAAADAYHAIRSNRPYRSGRTHEEATSELTRCSGKQFDPRIVDALLSILEANQELQALAAGEAAHPQPAAAGAASF